MAQQNLPETGITTECAPAWEKMTTLLAAHPGALIKCKQGGVWTPEGAYLRGITAEWRFHTPNHGSEGIRKHYKVIGIAALNLAELEGENRGSTRSQLHNAAYLLDNATYASKNPRRSMHRDLLGVPRPGRIFGRALPVDELRHAVGVTLPQELNSIGVFSDSQRLGECAGRETLVEMMSVQNHDDSAQAAERLAQLNVVADVLGDPSVAEGAPMVWHGDHGNIFSATFLQGAHTA